MNENKKTFDVYGVSLRVTSTLEDFINFVSRNYCSFDTVETNQLDIQVNYSQQAGKYAAEQKSSFRFFGEGIYIGDKKIYWENKYGFRVLLAINEAGDFEIHSFHHDLIGKADQEERLKDFQRSMRWAIHFPVFVRLQYQQNLSLIHASAAAKDGKAIVFCGLNKVGKSTLAVYLATECGYDLVTDNFLLVGENSVYGFPEVIRLSPKAAKKFDLDSIWDELVYGKYHIEPETIGTELKASPAAFVFVSQGSEVQIQEIDSSSSWKTMQYLHTLLGEFPEHSYLGMWPYLTGQSMNLEPATNQITSTSWYDLTYEPDWNIDAVFREVEECI